MPSVDIAVLVPIADAEVEPADGRRGAVVRGVPHDGRAQQTDLLRAAAEYFAETVGDDPVEIPAPQLEGAALRADHYGVEAASHRPRDVVEQDAGFGGDECRVQLHGILLHVVIFAEHSAVVDEEVNTVLEIDDALKHQIGSQCWVVPRPCRLPLLA